MPASSTIPDHRVSSASIGGVAKLAEYARTKVRRKRRERAIEAVLLLAACVSVFTTVGIVYVLLKESILFFTHVPLWSFLTDTQWTPLFDDAHFGIMVLLAGHLDEFGRRAVDRDSARHHHRDLPVRIRRPQDARSDEAAARTAERHPDHHLRLFRAPVRHPDAAKSA